MEILKALTPRVSQSTHLPGLVKASEAVCVEMSTLLRRRRSPCSEESCCPFSRVEAEPSLFLRGGTGEGGGDRHRNTDRQTAVPGEVPRSPPPAEPRVPGVKSVSLGLLF